EIMIQQVVRHGRDMLAHSALFVVRSRDEIVVHAIEKVMAVELVRAGVALPVPLSISAQRPPRRDALPQMIARLPHLPVVFGAVLAIRIGTIRRQDRARHESTWRRMRSALRNRAQKAKRLECRDGAASRLLISRRRREAL